MAEETQESKPVFDPEMFRASLMEEMTKTFNGIAKDLRKEIGKLAPTPAPTKPVEPQEPEPKGNPNVPAEVNAELSKRDREMKTLRDTLDSLTKERDTERTARMESERVSKIKDVMSGLPFRDEAASKNFYKIVQSDVVRDEDGQLVAKTENGFITVEEYVRNIAETLPGLMLPQGRGGSGATPGKLSKGGTLTLDDIKPGMSASDQAAIARQALQALGVNY